MKLEDAAGILADPWLQAPFRTAEAHLEGQSIEAKIVVEVPEHMTGDAQEQYLRGAEIYSRDGHCSTCHQPDGLGLMAGGFPPLAESPWVTEDEDRLIKLTLNGLLGPMEFQGRQYPGLVPMTPFGGMLKDEELADVLTYVRNSFDNRADPISASKIAEVRVATQSKVGFYSPEELEGGAASTSRAFVKFWELADLEDAFATPLRGRDFERGREMFEVASCVTCHNMQGEGANLGADLSRAGTDYPGAELLRHILEPSLEIRDEHRVHAFELDDESIYFGQIVERDGEGITIAESLHKPDETVWLGLDEIVETTPLDVSPMPSGLLVILSREEILDLVAYIAANGDEGNTAFD